MAITNKGVASIYSIVSECSVAAAPGEHLYRVHVVPEVNNTEQEKTTMTFNRSQQP